MSSLAAVGETTDTLGAEVSKGTGEEVAVDTEGGGLRLIPSLVNYKYVKHTWKGPENCHLLVQHFTTVNS